MLNVDDVVELTLDDHAGNTQRERVAFKKEPAPEFLARAWWRIRFRAVFPGPTRW